MLNKEQIMNNWDDWCEQIMNGDESSGPRDSFESLIDKYHKIISDLIEGLNFYADPDTYFAIMILSDPPCGEFYYDFSDDHKSNQYDNPMPGKLARKVIQQVEKELAIDNN